MNFIDFSIRILVALILGLLIGFERHWHSHTVALRTNALVALGSALFVSLSDLVVQSHSDVFRIAAAVVSGIGFLGAGFIFSSKTGGVKGLNTASTVWCSGAIGTLAGAGFLLQASLGAVLIALTNTFFRLTPRKGKTDD